MIGARAVGAVRSYGCACLCRELIADYGLDV